MPIRRNWSAYQAFGKETARLRNNVITAAALILLLLSSVVMAEENYCSLLPVSDVAAALGAPVSQSGDRVPSGTPQLLAQNCKYETKEVHRKYLDMNVTVTPTAEDAGKVFKAASSIFGSTLGPQPFAGLGDEAVLYTKPGSLYVRKKNVCLHFNLSGYGLSDDTKAKLLKLITTKALTLDKSPICHAPATDETIGCRIRPDR